MVKAYFGTLLNYTQGFTYIPVWNGEKFMELIQVVSTPPYVEKQTTQIPSRSFMTHYSQVFSTILLWSIFHYNKMDLKPSSSPLNHSMRKLAIHFECKRIQNEFSKVTLEFKMDSQPKKTDGQEFKMTSRIQNDF